MTLLHWLRRLVIIFALAKQVNSHYFNSLKCLDESVSLRCGIKLRPGDSLSKACNQLYIEVDSPASEASEIKILFQEGLVIFPDPNLDYQNLPSSIQVVGKKILNSTSSKISLEDLILPSDLKPCAKGHLIIALLTVSNGSALDLTSIPIEIYCERDFDFELNVIHQDELATSLSAGIQNPFDKAGVKSAEIVYGNSTEIEYCVLEVVSFAYCGNDWINGNANATGEGFNFADLNPLYIHDLHDSSLLNNLTMKIDLNKTALSENIFGNCALGLVLDPYQLCPDLNRSNNLFFFKVHITPDEKFDGQICEVYGANAGDEALLLSTTNFGPNVLSYKDGFLSIVEDFQQLSGSPTIASKFKAFELEEKTFSKCSATFEKVIQTKSKCPAELFGPLLTIADEVNAIWKSIDTNDTTLKSDLDNIKLISDVQAKLFYDLTNLGTFSDLCPSVVKALVRKTTTLLESCQGQDDIIVESFRGFEQSHQKPSNINTKFTSPSSTFVTRKIPDGETIGSLTTTNLPFTFEGNNTTSNFTDYSFPTTDSPEISDSSSSNSSEITTESNWFTTIDFNTTSTNITTASIESIIFYENESSIDQTESSESLTSDESTSKTDVIPSFGGKNLLGGILDVLINETIRFQEDDHNTSIETGGSHRGSKRDHGDENRTSEIPSNFHKWFGNIHDQAGSQLQNSSGEEHRNDLHHDHHGNVGRNSSVMNMTNKIHAFNISFKAGEDKGQLWPNHHVDGNNSAEFDSFLERNRNKSLQSIGESNETFSGHHRNFLRVGHDHIHKGEDINSSSSEEVDDDEHMGEDRNTSSSDSHSREFNSSVDVGRGWFNNIHSQVGGKPLHEFLNSNHGRDQNHHNVDEEIPRVGNQGNHNITSYHHQDTVPDRNTSSSEETDDSHSEEYNGSSTVGHGWSNDILSQVGGKPLHEFLNRDQGGDHNQHNVHNRHHNNYTNEDRNTSSSEEINDSHSEEYNSSSTVGHGWSNDILSQVGGKPLHEFLNTDNGGDHNQHNVHHNNYTNKDRNTSSSEQVDDTLSGEGNSSLDVGRGWFNNIHSQVGGKSLHEFMNTDNGGEQTQTRETSEERNQYASLHQNNRQSNFTLTMGHHGTSFYHNHTEKDRNTTSNEQVNDGQLGEFNSSTDVVREILPTLNGSTSREENNSTFVRRKRDFNIASILKKSLSNIKGVQMNNPEEITSEPASQNGVKNGLFHGLDHFRLQQNWSSFSNPKDFHFKEKPLEKPIGLWEWGILDVGLIPRHLQCSPKKKCFKKKTTLDHWYQDCLCPSIWDKGSDQCKFGTNIDSNFGRASIIVKKFQNILPKPDLDVCNLMGNDLFKDQPVDSSDLESMLKTYTGIVASMEKIDPRFQLLGRFLEKVTPKLMNAIQMVLQQIQGLMIYNNLECDWSGEPGSPPSIHDVCEGFLQMYRERQLHCNAGHNEEAIQSCGESGSGFRIPKIWKRNGNVVQTGSFCSFTGLWHWKNVAACPTTSTRQCHSCQNR